MASKFDGLQVSGSVQGNFTCRWTIERFSSLDSGVGKCHKSGVIPLGEKSMDWYLRLYPGGVNEDSEGYVSCFLERMCKTDSAKLKFNLSLRNIDGVVLFDAMDDKWEEISKYGYGYYEVIKVKDLTPLLVEDILVVIVDVTYCATCVKDGVETYQSAEIPPMVGMIENMRHLWKSKDDTDCIISVRGEDIPAHSFILGMHSRVFAAMFNHNTVERDTGRVEITDFEKDTMNSFIEFFYSGDVHKMNLDLALDLLRASDKYEVSYMKLYCANYLMSLLNSNNVCRILASADIHNADKLRSHAIEYICENLSADDLEAQRSTFMEQPELFWGVLRRFAKKRRIWKAEDRDKKIQYSDADCSCEW